VAAAVDAVARVGRTGVAVVAERALVDGAVAVVVLAVTELGAAAVLDVESALELFSMAFTDSTFAVFMKSALPQAGLASAVIVTVAFSFAASVGNFTRSGFVDSTVYVAFASSLWTDTLMLLR
jgi:hypothetical protein